MPARLLILIFFIIALAAPSAAKAGKSERSIMAQGRWRSVAIVRGYVRPSLFTDHAAASGLARELETLK